MTKLGVVRVRGSLHIRVDVKQAFESLRLTKKNYGTIVEDTPTNRGIIQKLDMFIAWGEITPETEKVMQKRKHNNLYTLQPPRKGYGRKGIKMAFTKGGALGYRGDKINDLIQRMI